MKNFRTREIGGAFYPQWRFTFFRWRYFKKMVAYDAYETIEFKTLKEAEDFLSFQTETIHIPKKQSNSNFSLFSYGNITQQNNKEEKIK